MKERVINYLCSKLKEFSSSVNLDHTYQNTKYDCPLLSVSEINELEKESPLKRQIKLKRLVSKELMDNFEHWDANEWIVHEWGGIRRFNVNNHHRIFAFRDQLTHGSLDNLNCISSLSKIASFVRPQSFFVYDSRVAFAINGILLDFVKQHPKERNHVVFFPIPSAPGQRKQQMEFAINRTVLNAPFIPEADSYIDYNKLVLTLGKKLNNNQPPCWVEMLLFELGKTNGIISQLCGISADNQKHNVKDRKPKANRIISRDEYSLTVYLGGRTLRIIPCAEADRTVKHVFVEYRGQIYEAQIKTYRRDRSTLRHSQNIYRDLVLRFNWNEGLVLHCLFSKDGTSHIYRITD